MVQVDDLPRTIAMPWSRLLQFPVKRLLLRGCSWALTFEGLLLLRTLLNAPTKRSITGCRNMANLGLLHKPRVDGSHRWLFQRFVVVGNILLK